MAFPSLRFVPDFENVFVIDFGKEFSDKEMPVMTKSYLGMDEDAK